MAAAKLPVMNVMVAAGDLTGSPAITAKARREAVVRAVAEQVENSTSAVFNFAQKICSQQGKVLNVLLRQFTARWVFVGFERMPENTI